MLESDRKTRSQTTINLRNKNNKYINLISNLIYIYIMSKTLWHTIKLEVPKVMVHNTKNDKVVVQNNCS